MRTRAIAIVITTLLIAAAPAAAAESAETTAPAAASGSRFGQIPDRFRMDLGGFAPSLDTQFQANRPGGLGTVVDFEDVFDLSSRQDNFRADLLFRFNPRHGLGARYFSFSRSSTGTVNQTIDWGDQQFDLSAGFESGNSIDYGGLEYRWSFVRREGLEVGLLAGISYIDLSANLSGQATLIGSGNPPQSTESSLDIGAPVPVIGLVLNIELWPRVFLRNESEYFRVRVQGFGGSLADTRTSIEWYPWRHVGFGAGYNMIRLRADETTGDDIDANFTYTIRGGRYYLSLSW